MLRKKWNTAILVLLMTVLFFTGCGKQEKVVTVNPVDAENYNHTGNWFGPVMKGENGFYLKGGLGAAAFCFLYVDSASGKSIYVCNRPECQHQQDEFCTATSDRYLVSGYTMYDGEIYIAAYDEQKADGKRFVLLRLEPDGSALTELCVLKEETTVDSFGMVGGLFIHRGICFANYAIMSSEQNQIIYGTAVYNLLDGTTAQLPEYEYALKLDGTSHDMGEVRSSFMGNEYYVYYNETRKNPGGRSSKNVLCRYNLEDGTIEDMENVIRNYTGVYTVTEPGVIVATDKFGNLYRYDWESKELEKHDAINYEREYTSLDEEGKEKTISVYVTTIIPSSFLYYNDTLYAFVGPSLSDDEYLYFYVGMGNLEGVYTIDSDWNAKMIYGADILDVAVRDHITPEQYEEYKNTADEGPASTTSWGFGMMAKASLTQDTLYLQTEKGLYQWPMSDFTAHTGGFEKVYTTEAANE